ncbi:hypothetical protein SHO565_75600 [Streptomyces sp. HO565]
MEAGAGDEPFGALLCLVHGRPLQPHRDVFVVDGLPGSPLDPSSTADGTTSRMALDATRGPGFDGVRITVAEDSRRTARRLLGDGAG